MGYLAIVSRAVGAYPALLPIVLVSLAVMIWAWELKRRVLAAIVGSLGCTVCFLYVGGTADAIPRLEGGGMQAAIGRQQSPGEVHAFPDPGHFSSGVRLHPRFPRDFPIPRSFRLESNAGGVRAGNLTVRFRFTGEAGNAVCDLREQGRANGWDVEILAPHRMNFRKGGRVVEAWFSYPAHSVVLDIPDPE